MNTGKFKTLALGAVASVATLLGSAANAVEDNEASIGDVSVQAGESNQQKISYVSTKLFIKTFSSNAFLLFSHTEMATLSCICSRATSAPASSP